MKLLYDTPVGRFSAFQSDGGSWALSLGTKLVRTFESLEQLKKAVEEQKTGADEWDTYDKQKMRRHRDAPDMGSWYDSRAV